MILLIGCGVAIWFVGMLITYYICEKRSIRDPDSGVYALFWPIALFSLIIKDCFYVLILPVFVVMIMSEYVPKYSLRAIKWLMRPKDKPKEPKKKIENPRSNIPEDLKINTPEEYYELKRKVDAYGERMGRNYG